jgi:AraC-like DNA-binding protein
VYSQNQVIRNWSLFLFIGISLTVVVRILGWFFLQPTQNTLNYFQNLTWFSALFWLIIFSIVLVKPEILFGYQYIQKMTDYVKENSFFSKKIWRVDKSNKDIMSQKDQVLSEKINSLIPSYISNLEKISLHTDFFRTPEFSINDLAVELKIPVSHLSYVLKYHCNVSFVDYKKIVRVNDAVNQIKEGYLKTNTIESLAKLVGFISYNTFANAFKEITNSTAQDYA